MRGAVRWSNVLPLVLLLASYVTANEGTAAQQLQQHQVQQAVELRWVGFNMRLK